MKRCIDETAAKAMVHTMVTSKLDYCSAFLYGLRMMQVILVKFSAVSKSKIFIVLMVGDNCTVFGCGSARATKGIGIWKLLAPRNAEYKKWRDDLLNELTKTRNVDKNFGRPILQMTECTLVRSIFVGKT